MEKFTSEKNPELLRAYLEKKSDSELDEICQNPLVELTGENCHTETKPFSLTEIVAVIREIQSLRRYR